MKNDVDCLAYSPFMPVLISVQTKIKTCKSLSSKQINEKRFLYYVYQNISKFIFFLFLLVLSRQQKLNRPQLLQLRHPKIQIFTGFLNYWRGFSMTEKILLCPAVVSRSVRFLLWGVLLHHLVRKTFVKIVIYFIDSLMQYL